jgi:hypothetical protein
VPFPFVLLVPAPYGRIAKPFAKQLIESGKLGLYCECARFRQCVKLVAVALLWSIHVSVSLGVKAP